MSMTPMANMINPEVMGDMINAKIEAQLKLTPYAKIDTTLEGVPGDTKTVPSWNYIGDAADVAEGQEVGLTEMTANYATFSIKKAMKSVGLTQEAINSGYGNPVGQAESQLAKAIAGKVDSDVLDEAYKATMLVDKSASAIGYDSIVDAVTKFEDEEDGIDKVMFINPKQEATLLKDDDFISRDKFTGEVAVTGAIGKIAGCWIKKSAKVKEVEAVEATKGEYKYVVGGTVASGDKITINGTEVTLDGTSGASASAAAGAVRTALGSDTIYDVSGSGANVVLKEKTGKEGTGAPAYAIVSTAGTVTETIVTQGVAAHVAYWACPIIKLEIDSPETEYTDDELPAITIFLKKDTQTDAEFKPRTQTHEITTAKYYGVALTNAAKVVLAKFGK